MTPQCLQRLQTPCANMKIVWHGNNSIPAMCALLKLEHDKICVNYITPYTFCIKLPSIARLWSPFALAFKSTQSHTFFFHKKKPSHFRILKDLMLNFDSSELIPFMYGWRIRKYFCSMIFSTYSYFFRPYFSIWTFLKGDFPLVFPRIHTTKMHFL